MELMPGPAELPASRLPVDKTMLSRSAITKAKRTIWGVVAIVAVALCIGFAVHLFQIARLSANKSLVLSVHASIRNLEIVEPEGTGWTLLTNEDVRRIMEKIDHASLDYGRIRQAADGVPRDLWGNRLRIAIRRGAYGGVEYMVSSLGPDETADTSDDIVAAGDREKTYSGHSVP